MFIGEKNETGSYRALPLTLEKLEPNVFFNEPTVSMKYEEAQKLIDALWDVGLRPSEGSGSAGAMAATQKHLEDMRKLVFADKQ